MSNLDQLTPGAWAIDSAHSTVGFTARHLMITKVHGRFGTFSGTITIADEPLQSRAEATIELGSVSTGDDGRDAHLRGEDFLDVERYPTMTFASTGVKADGDDFVLLGDLTIKDVTRHVELGLELEGVSPDPWGGTRAAFSAKTEISRKDWGLTWNLALETGGVVVSDKVTIELDIQAVRQ
jgi:polyisoprenoid-binding protein YceI